ncbi:hypothetical protein BKA62DRAFT_184533 [Auriculariales sp. MPI-PUGE-AT-0066]|nr:hypothetical protein BKA62DRAFT_184533 [Auriculariales sp. MPI-PUGE-AT-0066]
MPIPARTVHAPLDVRVATYTCAKDIPLPVWTAWRRHETAANIMFPHAEAALRREEAGVPPIPGQLWIALSSRSILANGEPSTSVDIVLSCTEWAMGTYPVFIFVNPTSQDAMSPSMLNSRVSMLAAELISHVPVRRVYSIFAPTRVTKIFTRIWSNMTGMQIESEPYYSAVFSYATASSVLQRKRHAPAPTGDESRYILRLAEEADVLAVAALCMGFASTSDPFTLTHEGAVKEASYLIRNRLVWLHEVENSTGQRQAACIVATTRQSDSVSGITKVYTSPEARRQGCAERLVRHVCDHLFLREQKKAVVLYVAHSNPGATKVYHRVGFQGLSTTEPRPAGVEDWLELGFQGSELGHW